MRTEDLIEAIARDAAAPSPWLGGRMGAALVFGAVVSGAFFALIWGVRPDVMMAMHDWRFTFKIAVAALSLVAAIWASARLAHPETCVRDVVIALGLAPAVLALAVGYELLTVPAAEWSVRAVGHNALLCLVSIPLLSLVPLAAVLGALRVGAPRFPATAGAVAGLLAAGVGAMLYATHCTDDSPLFVALWYPVGIGLITLLGAAAGRRVLRW